MVGGGGFWCPVIAWRNTNRLHLNSCWEFPDAGARFLYWIWAALLDEPAGRFIFGNLWGVKNKDKIVKLSLFLVFTWLLCAHLCTCFAHIMILTFCHLFRSPTACFLFFLNLSRNVPIRRAVFKYTQANNQFELKEDTVYSECSFSVGLKVPTSCKYFI